MSWPKYSGLIRDKIRWYRAASDETILRCITDRPQCGYAEIHRQIDLPFAKREAKKRRLDENINSYTRHIS